MCTIKPAAWIVLADQPFVTMHAPIEGGLPRIELYGEEALKAATAAERQRCREIAQKYEKSSVAYRIEKEIGE